MQIFVQPAALACCELVERASHYLDDELSERNRARFSAHLSTCAGCRIYVRQLETIHITLRGLPPDCF